MHCYSISRTASTVCDRSSRAAPPGRITSLPAPSRFHNRSRRSPASLKTTSGRSSSRLAEGEIPLTQSPASPRRIPRLPHHIPEAADRPCSAQHSPRNLRAIHAALRRELYLLTQSYNFFGFITVG